MNHFSPESVDAPGIRVPSKSSPKGFLSRFHKGVTFREFLEGVSSGVPRRVFKGSTRDRMRIFLKGLT